MVMREKTINPLTLCPECKEYTKTGHFVPPSLGEEGRYICDSMNVHEQLAGIEKRKQYKVPPELENKKEEKVEGLPPNDEGPTQIQVSLTPDKKVLIINFSKEVHWFGLGKQECLEFGKLLITRATMEMVE
jgi:hypothetical protein